MVTGNKAWTNRKETPLAVTNKLQLSNKWERWFGRNETPKILTTLTTAHQQYYESKE